jgi:hypothetical protein
MAKKFELNFRGQSFDDLNYDTGLRIEGEMDIIGRLFAEYALMAAHQGQPEPMRILVAAFERLQKNMPENGGKIIKPNFIN